MTVNIALVGLGYWGPNLARNLVLLEGGRLHTICDSRPDQLARYAALYPGVRATEDFDAVINDESVDAIVLATPLETHHRLARAALAAGKHVLVEKPLAATSDQCRDLIDV